MSIIKSYIVPHPPMIIESIGKGREKEVQKTIDSYQEIAKEVKEIKPETIVILSPHTTMYSDWFHIISKETIKGDLKEFNCDISFEEKNDIKLIEEIDKIVKEKDFPAQLMKKGKQNLDHAEMVPLYFIEKEYKDFQLVVIGISGLPLIKHYELGIYLKEAIEKINRKVVLVASGDLSHTLKEDGPYGFKEEGPIYEKEMESIIKEGNFEKLMDYSNTTLEKIGDCGHRAFTILAGCFDKEEVETKIYSHEDVTGVGYLVGRVESIEEDKDRDFLNQKIEKEKERIKKMKEQEDEIIKLAREAIENEIKGIESKKKRTFRRNHNACFVTIYSYHQLRGCIGTYLPQYNSLEEEIIENAKAAAVKDPRFPKITKEELDTLEIHVDILKKPQLAKSIYEFDPKKYGILVLTNEKSGLLLPNIEGIDDVEEQLKIALKKGNIDEKEPYLMYKFEVERHEIKENV